MTARRIVAFLLLASVFAASGPPPTVVAANFGSNTASGGTGAHPCDESSSSQCVANNGTHTVDDIGLNAAWHTALNDAIGKYDSDPSVSVAWSASSAVDDVRAGSHPYGMNNLWGWTACDDGVREFDGLVHVPDPGAEDFTSTWEGASFSDMLDELED